MFYNEYMLFLNVGCVLILGYWFFKFKKRKKAEKEELKKHDNE